jgi:hypothetical protein
LLVALISLLDTGSAVRGALRIGGISVAQEQLALALALDAERVFCLAQGMTPEVIALQHQAERAGARFQVIAGPRNLLGQLAAGDELLALADGLFVSVPEAKALLETGPLVMVQPVEPGLDAGFERIDANRASGGAIRIPGRLVERLADIPEDYDVFSALLRIALQAGVTQRTLPSSVGSIWTLVRSEEEAHAIEPLWIRRQTGRAAPFNPSRGLAQILVRTVGPALLHAGSGSSIVVGAAILLGVMAFGAGWIGWIGTGLMLAAIGWVLAEAAGLIGRIEGRIVDVGAKSGWSWRAAYDWCTDALLVALLAWTGPIEQGQSLLHQYFPALMMVVLLRLVPRAIRAPWTAWLKDRALLAIAMGLAVIAGVADSLVPGMALVLALLGIAWPRNRLG